MIRTWVFIVVVLLFASLIYRGWQGDQEIVANVKDTAIDAQEKTFSGNKRAEIHTFQVAAFTSSKQARGFVNLLKAKGVRDVYQVKTKRKSGETWYKIRVGRFDSKKNAQKFASQLIDQKTIKNYFIISLPIN
jgi:cell division protein FtsN